MTDYKDELQHLKSNNERLFKTCPDVGKAFMSLHGKACEAKKLDEKQKELIALGIAICIRCEGCIISHINSAIKYGAGMEEIAETVEIAILMGGGPSTVYGGKALECAEQLLS